MRTAARDPNALQRCVADIAALLPERRASPLGGFTPTWQTPLMMRRLALLSAFLAVPGCANVTLTRQAEKSISAITIDRNVKLADRVYYYGPEHAVGAALGGMIGVVIAATADSEPAKIKRYMEQNGVNVTEIVASEVEVAVRQTAGFPWPVRENTDAVLRIDVQQYGLMHKMAFSTEYKPWLVLQLELVDKTGTVVWQDRAIATNLTSQTPGYSYDQYLSDPEYMRRAYAEAARFTVSEVLGKLLKNIDSARSSTN